MKNLLIISLVNCLFINSSLFARAQTTLDYQDRIHAQSSENFMVVSQNIHATEAGYEILSKGGNAVDAAVAVGFALAVTLPRAGNLGGGGVMLSTISITPVVFTMESMDMKLQTRAQ